ncbi:MAG: thymidine kinase [Bacteroidota bacterium]|nr:thymidine kinase [Bacteroidota bacterium]
MFIEPRYQHQQKKGWIEVICGSMFSGKTEELIRRVTRAKIANQKVELFKPNVDVRYDETQVVSHNENAVQATPVASSLNILLMVNEATVVAIDEAQFFDEELIYVSEKLAEQGKRVIIAGLDMDYLGKPFGCMPKLMAVAEYVTKVHAICMVCGDLANHSYRKTNHDSLIMLGETDTYEARCRQCFNRGMTTQK